MELLSLNFREALFGRQRDVTWKSASDTSRMGVTRRLQLVYFEREMLKPSLSSYSLSGCARTTVARGLVRHRGLTGQYTVPIKFQDFEMGVVSLQSTLQVGYRKRQRKSKMEKGSPMSIERACYRRQEGTLATYSKSTRYELRLPKGRQVI